MGIKITLEQCRRQGDERLIFYCMNHGGPRSGCHHTGSMNLADAIERWGPEVRLDDLPLYCSKCGSKNVDVRGDRDVGPGGFPVGTGPNYP